MIAKDYKLTKLGIIPKEWTIKKGEEITEKITKGSSPNWQGFDYQKEGVLFVTSENVRDGFLDINRPKYLPIAFSEKQKNSKLKKGDLLINIVGASIGRSCEFIADVDANINQAVCLFRVKFEADKEFVKYYLQQDSVIRRLLGTQTESARPNLSLADMREFEFILPEKNEEKSRIASILSTWDKAIELKGKLIQQKKEQKKGLMQKLLTGKVRLPGFEGEWAETLLGDLGTFLKGKGIKKNEVVEEGLNCIRYGEIYTVHHFYIKRFNSFITSETAIESCKIQKNDLLFAGSGETAEEIGKAVALINDEEAYAGGDIIILRPTSQVDSLFLSFIVNVGEVAKQRTKLAQGNSVVHIYPSNLASLKVNLPSYEEQRAISKLLKNFENQLDLLTQEVEALNQQKKGLMQLLLTGKVRVKV